MTPEVERPIPCYRSPKEEILQLSKIEKRRSLEDSNPISTTKEFVVKEKWVVLSQKAFIVAVHGARVVHNDNVIARPSSRNIAQDCLPQHCIVPREWHEKRSSRVFGAVDVVMGHLGMEIMADGRKIEREF